MPKKRKTRQYADEERRRLRNRLIRIVGHESRIDDVMKAMERAGINANVAQLRRKLRRTGIYPPRVDSKGNRYAVCLSPSSKGRRSFTPYYVRNGVNFEAHLERQTADPESLTLLQQEDPEAFAELYGESPGIVVRLRRQKRRAGK
jgi:hypothetical protein